MFIGDLDPGQAPTNTPEEEALMTSKLK